MHNHGLGAWMAKRRLKSPDAIALIHGDGDTVTYRELADGTDRVSALLWHRGASERAIASHSSARTALSSCRCSSVRRSSAPCSSR